MVENENENENRTLNYPPSNQGMFYLFLSDIRYDKLLCLDGSSYALGCNKDWVMLFESFKRAKKYAEKKVKENPEVVVTIQDSEKKPVLMIKDEAHYAAIRKDEFGVGRKKWWQFWKPL